MGQGHCCQCLVSLAKGCCPAFTWGLLLVAGLVLGGVARAGAGSGGRAAFWGTAGLAWSGFRHTDADGRCQPLLAPGQAKSGTYKLHFETAEYWQGLGHTSFYPFVEVRSGGKLGQVTHKVWGWGQAQGAALLQGLTTGGGFPLLSPHSPSGRLHHQRPSTEAPCPAADQPLLLHNLPGQLEGHSLSLGMQE